MSHPPSLLVTGLGIWSAAGSTPAEAWERALRGATSAESRRIGDRLALACFAPDPGACPCPGFPQSRRLDRSARLALAAAVPAARQARLESLPPERIAVLVGNSRGPAGLWETSSESPAGTLRRVRPTLAAHTAIASLSGALSLGLRVKGPCLTVSATCASAAHAIALGAGLLLGGVVDAVLAGGAEAPLGHTLLDQFHAAGLLGTHPDPRRACRPFDRTRNGMVPGEGAAFLVLERDDRLPGSDRPPALARLLGWSMTAECHNRVAARPDGDGLARALREALAIARLGPGDIGHINAHGTGTRVNDAAEASALRQVFGSKLGEVAVSSTKPVTGHGFGAAAALEAVLAIEALRAGMAPPTAGFLERDPELDPLTLTTTPRPFRRPSVLSTSLGFWGNAAALVFGLP